MRMIALLLVLAAGCSDAQDLDGRRFQEEGPASHEQGQVYILQPENLGGLHTNLRTPGGQSISVECSACHTLHQNPPFAKKVADLEDFHKDMTFEHGNLDCLSCHAREDRSKLHLAAGETLRFSQTMELCSQCHGPQSRDYRRGSHGGMTGYWDLNSGDRQRNACVFCHNPHTPAHSKVLPVFSPKDRFLSHDPDGEHP